MGGGSRHAPCACDACGGSVGRPLSKASGLQRRRRARQQCSRPGSDIKHIRLEPGAWVGITLRDAAPGGSWCRLPACTVCIQLWCVDSVHEGSVRKPEQTGARTLPQSYVLFGYPPRAHGTARPPMHRTAVVVGWVLQRVPEHGTDGACSLANGLTLLGTGGTVLRAV